MDYITPKKVVETMLETGEAKAAIGVKDLVIRGFLAGALLGYATSLALTATDQTGIGLIGAILFPVSFVIILLLGLELVTGNFALMPIACHAGKITQRQMYLNWGWVFAGNLIGSLCYGGFLYLSLTSSGQVVPTGVAALLTEAAEAKTIGYANYGAAGMLTVVSKAILCNWMVCLGVVMAMTSTSTLGKIAAAWLPILIFFAQGFEHSVVNMFVIPTGMLLGADVTVTQWWLWNQIPVTVGNLIGGAVFTGFALYTTYGTRAEPRQAAAVVPQPLGQPAYTE